MFKKGFTMIGNETSSSGTGLLGSIGNVIGQAANVASQGQALLQTIKGGTPPVGANANNQPTTSEVQARDTRKRYFIIGGIVAAVVALGFVVYRSLKGK